MQTMDGGPVALMHALVAIASFARAAATAPLSKLHGWIEPINQITMTLPSFGGQSRLHGELCHLAAASSAHSRSDKTTSPGPTNENPT
ncbi:hypothetical protein BC940DRAFT_301198 [Gongronella butleri]|nr:hypothetical protein BC940DRAFT_301198 [Gongronella butleri]